MHASLRLVEGVLDEFRLPRSTPLPPFRDVGQLATLDLEHQDAELWVGDEEVGFTFSRSVFEPKPCDAVVTSEVVRQLVTQSVIELSLGAALDGQHWGRNHAGHHPDSRSEQIAAQAARATGSRS